jgi:hypothetical protein
MQRRSTLWFVLAAAWFALFVVNGFRHRDKNTLVIGIAVVVFLVIGAVYRWHDSKKLAARKLRAGQQGLR